MLLKTDKGAWSSTILQPTEMWERGGDSNQLMEQAGEKAKFDNWILLVVTIKIREER